MKRGVKRIKPTGLPIEQARSALRHLQMALFHASAAGACYTAERIRHAISSAKGAVRAAEYREYREDRARSFEAKREP